MNLVPADTERFLTRVNKAGPVVRPELGPCWVWTGTVNNKGYGMFHVDGSNKSAHRVSWWMFRGAISTGIWVLHKCDNRVCVSPDHLFLGTASDNANDMVLKDRHCVPTLPGEANPAAKLTADAVKEIRLRHAAGGVSMRALGREFGVDPTVIQDIVHRRKWQHVA